MRAAGRLVCLLLSVTAGALAPAMPAHAAQKRAAAAVDHAAVLEQMQAVIARMAVSRELVPADAEELALTLTRVRGRTIDGAALRQLTVRLAIAIADGSFDDESIERLAQDLFAAVNSSALSGREATLLVTDVDALLRESGAQRELIESATAALAALGPGGVVVRTEAPSSRAGSLLVLTRP
jgi:hypothetical protein